MAKPEDPPGMNGQGVPSGINPQMLEMLKMLRGGQTGVQPGAQQSPGGGPMPTPPVPPNMMPGTGAPMMPTGAAMPGSPGAPPSAGPPGGLPPWLLAMLQGGSPGGAPQGGPGMGG